MQSWLFATDMRENDYGQIPLLANSMSHNYLYVPVLASFTTFTVKFHYLQVHRSRQ